MADAFEQFVQSSEGMKLYRAISLISDASVRARLILPDQAFSDGEIRPEDRESEHAIGMAWTHCEGVKGPN